MFFNDFSQIFRGDVVFLKNEKLYRFYIDYGSSKCCYFAKFRDLSGNTRFFAGAFSMNSLQDIKSGALVEPKNSKQWKSLCESDNSRFLCFFDCLAFREQ